MEQFFDSGWADGLELDATSVRDYGDAVIVRVVLSAQGRSSGLGFMARVFQVFTLRDGRIVRIEDFLDRQQALEAAGSRGDRPS